VAKSEELKYTPTRFAKDSPAFLLINDAAVADKKASFLQ
jgi:hypothetical protein